MSSHLTEESLIDIVQAFQELLDMEERMSLDGLAIIREVWNKEAMQLAAKRLPKENRIRLLEMVKTLDRTTQVKVVPQSVPLYG